MGRLAKEKKLYMPPPVSKVELSEKHIKFRIVALVLFLLIGIGALVYALFSSLQLPSGWNVIEFSPEITFDYDLGSSGVKSHIEQRDLKEIGNTELVRLQHIFDAHESYDDVSNIHDLSRHVGEVVNVDPVLYDALELLEKYGDRNIFLAPIFLEYNNLLYSKYDHEALHFDVYRNEEEKVYYKELLSFIQDRDQIRLELMGKDQVRLFVAKEYLEYAKEIGFVDFVDLAWMKNAFVVDALAKFLMEHGYTKGVLRSYDGYLRNLDTRNVEYTYPIFARKGKTIYPVGRMEYSGELSLVNLRDFPMSALDDGHYYEYEDGEIRTTYIDPNDGYCKASRDHLICYSKERSCAEILLGMIPVYVTEHWDVTATDSLRENGIQSIYCEDGQIISKDPLIQILYGE